MTSHMIVFMFSGQGSQYFQMAKELYRQDPVFTEWLDRLDRIVVGLLGKSVVDAVYSPDRKIGDPFDDLQLSHPAIVMWEYAMAQSLIEDGIEPDFVFGTSLGEYVAAAVAGILPVEDILRLIVEQAEIVLSHCPEGRMLTILDSPQLFRQNAYLFQHSELASVNYHSHFVVSGTTSNISAICAHLKGAEISHQVLPVPYAFHSSLVNAAQTPFLNAVGAARYFNSPIFPYVSGVTGNEVEEFDAAYFWDVVRQPIRLPEAVSFLETCGPCAYVDLGPSGTNANFVKYNLPESTASKCFPLLSPFGGGKKRHQAFKEFISTSH